MLHTFLKKTINQKRRSILERSINKVFASGFQMTHFRFQHLTSLIVQSVKKVDVKINDLNESFAIPRTHQLNQAKKNLAKGHTNSNDEILMFQLHGLRPF